MSMRSLFQSLGCHLGASFSAESLQEEPKVRLNQFGTGGRRVFLPIVDETEFKRTRGRVKIVTKANQLEFYIAAACGIPVANVEEDSEISRRVEILRQEPWSDSPPFPGDGISASASLYTTG
jgi:hypothetical protein